MERVIDTSSKKDYGFWVCPNGYDSYNDDWHISPNGDLMSSKSGYEIGSDVLEHDDWILNLSEKRWFDANTFIPAYYEACRRKGVKIVQMRIDY